MLEATAIPDLLRRVRSGDEDAASELVRRIEPFVRRAVRIRMRHRGDFDRLRHEVGASDVCQSVFRSLFLGLREQRYHLDQPGELERFLRTIVRFHVATKARRAVVRLRELTDDFEGGGWMQPGPAPDDPVVERDLVGAIQRRFSEEELELLTLWLDGAPWADVGRKAGCTPDAVRVRLRRAVDRVRQEMCSSDDLPP